MASSSAIKLKLPVDAKAPHHAGDLDAPSKLEHSKAPEAVAPGGGDNAPATHTVDTVQRDVDQVGVESSSKTSEEGVNAAASAPTEVDTGNSPPHGAQSSQASTDDTAAPEPPSSPHSSSAVDTTESSHTTVATPEPHSHGPTGVSKAALAKQVAASQLTALRAIAHHAMAEMERWRRGPGAQQEAEVFAYWESWTAHIDATTSINERLLAFMRLAAAGAEAYALSMRMAAEALHPVSSGELLLGANATPATLAAITAGTHLPKKSSFFNFGSSSSHASGATTTTLPSGSGTPTGGSSGGGGGGVLPARHATVSGVSSETSAARHAFTLSILTAAIADVQAQGGEQLHELAGTISKDICGDSDGPLGKKGDRAHATHPDKKKVEAGAPCPTDLVNMHAWYHTGAEAVKKAGVALSEALAEVSAAAYEAYEVYDAHSNALISGLGRGRFKGQNLWLAELRYRRAARALLAMKTKFMAQMAGLFERYRAMEVGRTETIAATGERYTSLTARLFDRVSGKAVPEACKSLNTHADFFRVVQEDAVARIEALRTRWRDAEGMTATGASAGGGGGGGTGSQSEEAGEGAHASTSGGPSTASGAGSGGEGSEVGPGRVRGYTVYGAIGDHPTGGHPTTSTSSSGGGHGGAEFSHHAGAALPKPRSVHFVLDPAPAVISPLASPLVARVGMLLRQVGMMRSWKPVIAVLTREGSLYLFDPATDDLATHPDVINAINQWSAARPSDSVASIAGSVKRGSVHTGEVTTGTTTSAPDVSSGAAPAGGVTEPQQYSGGAHMHLPPPPLPADLMRMAAAYSSNVADLLPADSGTSSSGTEGDPVQLAKKANAAPSQSIPIIASTKLIFAPTIHPDAFEITDKSGFLGFSTKIPLRGASPDDCVDWVVALNAVIEAVTQLAAAGGE